MQALARVWRDGQKKDCQSSWISVKPHACTRADDLRNTGFVYRFVATGTVEEKSVSLSALTPSRAHLADWLKIQTVFQRQSHKQNLSSCVVDAKEDIERHYTGDNLRQLFQYKEAACEVRFH